MKNNKILPLILLAGGGFLAYQYFKKKDDQKDEIADKLPIEPELEKEAKVDDELSLPSATQSTRTQSNPNPLNTAFSILTPLVKKTAQKLTTKVRAKRKKSKIIIAPLESSSTPFAPIPKKKRIKRLKL